MSETNAHTASYVRTTMLPEQEPPVTERGVIKWVRENLFSSWLNILLTVLSLYVIYWALNLFLPWAFGGVWNAGSLSECREVLFAVYKGSHDGACWAVIEDRWLQIMFGFYPPEMYWRPILAFVLLFVALAPILFSDKVPAKMMWFSLAYPFLATWLIWGGAFWAPIFAAFGFVVAFAAYKALAGFAGPIVSNIGAIIAALVWWFVLMAPANDSIHKMIGTARFDSVLENLENRMDVLPDEIARLEAAADEKQAEIRAVVAEKNATLEEMRSIRAEEFALTEELAPKNVALLRLEGVGENLTKLATAIARDDDETADALIGDISGSLEAALSDLASAAEPAEIASDVVAVAGVLDPSILTDVGAMTSTAALTGPLEALVATASGLTSSASPADITALRGESTATTTALRANVTALERVFDKVVATNAAPLREPQARLRAEMAQLSALRNEATTIAQASFRLTNELSSSRGNLASIRSLERREASIPDLRSREAELRDALPANMRNFISINQLEEGAAPDDRLALTGYLTARNAANSAQNSVRETYKTLGRIGLTPINSRQIGGFTLAVIIGVAGIVLSLPLGILLALGRQSHLFIINKVCVTFIEVIRGVPLIVWLFTASLLLNYFLPPGANFDLMLRVIIMVTLFASAYIAEVIRGGLAALPTGQYEGADSLGLSYWQSMQLVILPQAMKISIPGIVNTFIGLFKDTTLVVFIGLLDPIGLSNAIRADTDWNGVYWELFIFIGVLFFLFCFSMGRYSLFLEKKLQREHR